MTMSLLGTALGVAIASFVIRALHSILYGVKSTDTATLAMVSALLLFVAFTANLHPRPTRHPRRPGHRAPRRIGLCLRPTGPPKRCRLALRSAVCC